MKTDLQLSHLSVKPGQAARLEVDVTNDADIIDSVTVQLEEIPSSWWRLDQPVVNLFPGDSGRIGLLIDVPTTGPAGGYPVRVHIVPTNDVDGHVVRDFWLTVEPLLTLGVDIVPAIVTGGKRARVTATISNLGNADAVVRLDADDPTRQIDCTLERSGLIVPFGQSVPVEVDFSGPRPWFGQGRETAIAISATVDQILTTNRPDAPADQPTIDDASSTEPVRAIATFKQKPRIARGVITAATLAAIVALWATIFLLIGDRLNAGEVVKKELAEKFFEGESDIPLAEIAGEARGLVVASTTGDGVGRLTVEALRLTTGRRLLRVASVATADDGTFEVASLLPGTYKLRISGEGFVDAWYPAAGTAPARQAVDADEWVLTPSSDPAVDPATQASLDQFIRIRSSRVQPVEDAEPIEIVLDGQPATLVGILSAASGDLGTTPEVTAIKVRERSDDVSGDDASGQPTVQIDDEPVQGGAADAGGLPGSAASGDDPALPEAADSGVVDGDPQRFVAEVVGDTFTFTDLPAPGTYLVTISDPAEGYQPQSFQQEVNGGDNTVLNPVQLAASSGIITGKVVGSGAASAGLGDVTVTARSGDVAARVTTPTTGSVGNYEIRNLPTPGTYVVTFERDGFSSRTIAVELAAGATWPVEDIRLAGGNGIIVGTAVSAVDGAPLGGLSVSVEGDAFRSETSTLTSGAGAGGFRFEELPIPADCADPAVVAANCTYTVTISGDSLSTEAVTATFSSAGTETLGNITMSATISQVGGTVQVAGASAGGVSVTLSSGAAPTVAAPRITTTVAEPAGVFSFDEVPPGSYTLEFRRSDLVTRVILLRVRAGENVTLPITLTTVPPPMEVT